MYLDNDHGVLCSLGPHETTLSQLREHCGYIELGPRAFEHIVISQSFLIYPMANTVLLQLENSNKS